MAKYYVSSFEGETIKVEAKSINGAIKKSGLSNAEVAGVAKVKPAPTSWCSLQGNLIKVTFPEGGEMIGLPASVNMIFELMGYGAVAIKNNMMSRKPYIEAVGTPGYCSPSSEAYWSM